MKCSHIKRHLYSALATLFVLVQPALVGAADPITGTGQVDFGLLSSQSIFDLIVKIVNAIFAIAIPVAVVFIVYAGFLFVSAGGSEEKLTTAKKTFGWAVVGLAIVLGAEIIVRVVKGSLGVQ